VDLFNDSSRPEFVFLLSSKAGGCGLNLVGANHLILFDSDWNPANDAQAMARVWRPGQKKTVYLYRTLSTGTIEEKIFQRQISKLSLASNVVGGEVDHKPSFTANETRDLFTLVEQTICETHDLLNCRCSRALRRIPLHKRQAANVGELVNWQHCTDISTLDKYLFLKHSCPEAVSFVFLKEENPLEEVNEDDLKVETVDLCFDQAEDCSEDPASDGDYE